MNFSGVAMLVEQGPAGISNGGGGATGVTYRPLAADDHLVVFTFHHAICDGWSLILFLRELQQL